MPQRPWQRRLSRPRGLERAERDGSRSSGQCSPLCKILREPREWVLLRRAVDERPLQGHDSRGYGPGPLCLLSFADNEL